MTSLQNIKYCYGAFAVCVIACAVPEPTVQTFAMVFSPLLLIALYIARSRITKGTFEHTEMSTLIKTFWIWSAIYVVGIIVAGGIISGFGDMTVIHEWTESVVNGGAVPDEAEMKRVLEQYMMANSELMTSATLICVLPSLLYALMRSKKAISRLNNPPMPAVEPVIEQI